MADNRRPYQIIGDMAQDRAPLSDAKVLAELAAIPPLADADDPCWDEDGYWHRVAYPYLALWDVVAQRRLRSAIPLILDRACFGDPGEIMRNICHVLEAIVKPDWSALTGPCVAALQSPRPGTRFWAASQLGRLEDPSAVPALEAAAGDPVPNVASQAAKALERCRS